MFAGYNIFKEDKVRRFWARRRDSKLRPQLLSKLYPYIFKQGGGKNAKFLENFFKRGMTETGSPVYSHQVRWNNTAQLHNFFSPEINNDAGLADFIERYSAGLPEGFMAWHPLNRAQYTEIRIFLTNYLLAAQGDRRAMANAVEGRYPFLDYRVIEYTARTPPRFKLNGLTEKFILKKLARNYIPQELIERPKQPYRAPISGCFFNDASPEYVAEMLSEASLRRAGYFDPAKVERLTAKCRTNAGQLLSERENMAKFFYWSWLDWSWVLKLAFDYGWDPKGTVLTFDAAYMQYDCGRQKDDTEFDPEYELMKKAIRDCVEWEYPGYFSNELQTVTRQDAQNLADALERALDKETNLFRRVDSSKAEVNTYSSKDSKKLPLTNDTDSDSGLREYVKEFITFCRGGESGFVEKQG